MKNLTLATRYPTPENRRLVAEVKGNLRQPAEVRAYATDILIDWDKMERERKEREERRSKKKQSSPEHSKS